MKFSIGKKFKTKGGFIATVIELDKENNHNVIVKIRNHTMIAHYGNLKSGMFESPWYRKYHGVGYIGLADIHSDKETFDIWIRMINKCHGKLQHATMYKWWDSYESFLSWYKGHYDPVYHSRFKRIIDTAKIYTPTRLESQFKAFKDMVALAKAKK